jgi:adenylate cyclase
MADEGFKRKLAAILSADVIGYSRLMRNDEEATVRDIAAHRVLISDIIQQHHGRVVDSPGDNILAEFASVVDAVNGAIKIQAEIKRSNADSPADRRMEFRIGINLGDVIEEEERIYGDGVNIAARVEGLASPGGIAISGTVYEHIKDKLSLGYRYLGEQDVKNIPEPVRVYRLLTEPADAGKLLGVEKKASKRGWLWAATAAVVVAIVGIGIWQFYLRPPPIEPASVEKMAYPLPEKPSIAVLPFDNMSGDPEQEYFSDGLSEEIITALSSVPELFVMARNSTFTYKGRPVQVKQVSEELGVQYVLEGSVRKSGEKVRITAQLIDALKGHHLWAESYDRRIEDIFVVQEEITMKIINELRVKMVGSEILRFDAPCSENLKAFLKYLEALGQFYRMNKEGNDTARRLTEEAVAIDPGYACAYSLLGGTYYADLWMGTARSPKRDIAKAKEMAEKAIALNPSLGGPHALLSRVLMMIGQHDKAIETARKAVDLQPNGTLGLTALGIALRAVGRSEESIPFLEQAVRIDPYEGLALYSLGMSYFFVGRYEEAIETSKKAVNINPNNYLAYLTLASTYSAVGKEKEARAAAEAIQKINPKLTLKYVSKITPLKSAEKELFISNLRNAGLYDNPPLPLPDKPSIAVLAFDNLSGDPEQEFFSDGISEEIISALSKTDQLFVIARNSSFVYKGKPVNVKQISRELGVRYVLEGSVRKSEDRVRITAQLIDATTDHHLWSERYDRELEDIFAVQDEITMKIITALQVELTEGEQMRMWAKRYKTLDVQLKAMELLSLWRKGTIEALIRHGQVSKEVVVMAPDQAVGYRGLGWNHWGQAYIGRSPRENLKKAFEFAQKAISLDESDGLSHALLGSIYSMMRQHEKAIVAGKRAVELDPNVAQVHLILGQTLNFAGRPDEAIEYLNKAIRLNPFPPYLYFSNLGQSYLQTGQYEKALTEYKKALQLAPKSPPLYIYLAVTYILLDREEEARASAAKALELAPFISVSGHIRTSRYKNEADLKLIVDAMRKAGFPEGT